MKVLVHRDTSGGSPDTLFVDIENDKGESVKYPWIERGDGYWEIDLGSVDSENALWAWIHETMECHVIKSAAPSLPWTVFDVDGEVVGVGNTPIEAMRAAEKRFDATDCPDCVDGERFCPVCEGDGKGVGLWGLCFGCMGTGVRPCPCQAQRSSGQESSGGRG